MKPQTIAVYSFILTAWFYWNAETEQFDLMQIEPGELVKVPEPPIYLKHRRRHFAKEGN